MPRVAIVTGAAAAAGTAAAFALAEAGLDVALLDTDESACIGAAGGVNGLGRRALAIGTDLADAGSVEAAVAKVCADLGDPALLLNIVDAAGYQGPGALPDEAWWAGVGAPLRTVFLACRAVLDPMAKNGGGQIINVADTTDGQAGNATVREGLAGLTRTLALELAPFGITANLLTAAPPAAAELPAPRRPVPAGTGFPEKVARAVSLLVSADATVVSGQVIQVGLG